MALCPASISVAALTYLPCSLLAFDGGFFQLFLIYKNYAHGVNSNVRVQFFFWASVAPFVTGMQPNPTSVFFSVLCDKIDYFLEHSC